MNANKGADQTGWPEEETLSMMLGQLATSLTKNASEAVLNQYCWPDEEIRSMIGPLAATVAKNVALESLKLVPGVYVRPNVID